MRQPGDGSCLFHSMSYGLGSGINASRLRSEICTFIQNNPELKISDTPLKVRSSTFEIQLLYNNYYYYYHNYFTILPMKLRLSK